VTAKGEKPMTMKDIRRYLAEQRLACDRNWMTEFITIYAKADGSFVAQGPRSEIETRIRAGELF
jgi:predicted nucleotidyltransferase